MKTKNTKKIVVSALAVAMGAGLVGSISGTVAWYQYSTRSTVSYEGASMHCTEALEIRIRSTDTTLGAWKSDLDATTIGNYLKAATAAGGANRTVSENALAPVTSGELAENKVASTLYKNPIYQYTDMSTWGVATVENDYIVLPLELRVKDIDGATDASYLAKKIYISDITMEARGVSTGTDPKGDVTDALRVGVKAAQTGAEKVAYTTFSKSGGNTAVWGELDLNNDGNPDKARSYSWQTAPTETLKYGYDSAKNAVSTATTQLGTDAANTVVGVANDSDPYAIKGKEIGSTATDKNLEVDLLIYLEGWQTLGSTPSALWNEADFVGAEFGLGITFTAEAHANH